MVLAAAPAIAQQAGSQVSGTKASKPFRLQSVVDLPSWLKVSGSLRPRYESLANNFTAGRTGGDDFLSWQALLKVEATPGADVFLGAELMDARRFAGDEAGSGPNEVDALEFSNLYVAWRPKDLILKGDNLDLMAGRFTMDVGSRRLVSRTGFGTRFTSFDGLRAVWSHKGGVKATAFYVSPVTRVPSDVPSAWDNEVAFNAITDAGFYGVNVESPTVFGLVGEVYLYDLQENDAARQPTRNRDIATTGARLKKAPKAGTWDIDVEYADQTGTSRNTTGAGDTINRDHDANMFHGEAGYTFDMAWKPRLSLHYDHASGDENAADLSVQRFDPLFGDRAFEFGPTSIWGAILRTNIDSPGVRLEVKPDARNEVMVMARNLRLDSATDSFGNSAVRDVTGASGKDVGVHYEIRWRHQIIPDSLRLTVGGAAISQGDFLENAPNATGLGDPYYGYTQLEFSF
jgi:alginate export protein